MGGVVLLREAASRGSGSAGGGTGGGGLAWSNISGHVLAWTNTLTIAGLANPIQISATGNPSSGHSIQYNLNGTIYQMNWGAPWPTVHNGDTLAWGVDNAESGTTAAGTLTFANANTGEVIQTINFNVINP